MDILNLQESITNESPGNVNIVEWSNDIDNVNDNDISYRNFNNDYAVVMSEIQGISFSVFKRR